jgi:hypothetical protein
LVKFTISSSDALTIHLVRLAPLAPVLCAGSSSRQNPVPVSGTISGPLTVDHSGQGPGGCINQSSKMRSNSGSETCSS